MLQRTIVAVGFLALSVASIAAEKLQPPVPAPAKSIEQKKPTTKQTQSDATGGLPKATSPSPVEIISPTYVLQSAPEDKPDNKQNYASAEWWLVYITAPLGAATLGLMFFTFRLWSATKRLATDANAAATRQAGEVQQSLTIARESADAGRRAAEIAQQSLIASNRAWVKVDIAAGGPIVYDADGARFTFDFRIMNVGHSAATNVWINVRIIYPTLPSGGVEAKPMTAVEDFQALIEQGKNRPVNTFGFVLFPGDFLIQPMILTMTKEDLKLASGDLGAIYPMLIGAVEYRLGFDNNTHQTGFAVDIGRPDVPRPYTTAKNRWPRAIWIEEGDVPQSEIRLFRSFITGGYAD